MSQVRPADSRKRIKWVCHEIWNVAKGEPIILLLSLEVLLDSLSDLRIVLSMAHLEVAV